MNSFSPREMMAIAAARRIHDGDIVFCGTGISMLAAMAAKHIYAPDCTIFFETGAVDSHLAELPLAVADSRVMYQASVNSGLADSFAAMQNRFTGPKVVAILGAAQIDPFGNLNSTCVGDPARPKSRFAGSGGACDAASFVGRTIVFMKHEKRKFPEKLDYLTSPGFLDGPDGRSRAGLPAGGPEAVITDIAVMGFDRHTRRMFLEGCYPGVTPATVLERMDFAVDITCSRPVDPPSPEELRILREVCDPQRLILG